MRYGFAILLVLVLPTVAAAQVSGPRTAGGCVLANDSAPKITVNGTLRRATFKDPTGQPERVLVVRLPGPTCVEDGGQGMLEGKQRVVDVQIAGADAEAMLAKRVGRHVALSGTAMPRNTGHHYTALLLADPIKLE